LTKVNLSEPKKRKLGPKTVDCAFLRYAHSSMTYRFLVIKSDTPEQDVNTIMESRDTSFFEDIFPMRAAGSTSLSENNHTHMYDPKYHTPPPESFDKNNTPSEEDNNLVNEPARGSKRPKIVKSFGDDFIVYLVDDVPKTLSQEYASPDADYWKDVIRSEMDSIMSNGTWEITYCPNRCKPIGCKWIFKKKLRHDGTIEKYKARLVAKEFTQREGENFFDTYSPVAQITTIRVLIALACSHALHIHQMDVKTAFLYGELDEEIYMEQPDGYKVHGQENKVCRLIKYLYGLKEAPKQWHEKFNTTLTSARFIVNEADKCVYYQYGGGKGVILCLYVDDILIFGTSTKVIDEIKSFLSRCFDMKDLGPADVILNIKLIKSEDGITLNQSHYAEKTLSRFGFEECKISPTPNDVSIKLHKFEGEGKDQLRYS
jgi:hypothetical protein